MNTNLHNVLKSSTIVTCQERSLLQAMLAAVETCTPPSQSSKIMSLMDDLKKQTKPNQHPSTPYTTKVTHHSGTTEQKKGWRIMHSYLADDLNYLYTMEQSSVFMQQYMQLFHHNYMYIFLYIAIQKLCRMLGIPWN